MEASLHYCPLCAHFTLGGGKRAALTILETCVYT